MDNIKKPGIELGNCLLWFSFETGASFFIYKKRACVKYGSKLVAISTCEDSKTEVIANPEWLDAFEGESYEVSIKDKSLMGFQYFELLRGMFDIRKPMPIFGPTIAIPRDCYEALRENGCVALDRDFNRIPSLLPDCYEIFKENCRFYVRTHLQGVGSPRLECMIQMLEDPIKYE